MRGYLISEDLTVTDKLAFSILLPWDEIYNVCFKINTRMVSESPAILKFMRTTYKALGKNEEILDRLCSNVIVQRVYVTQFF